ncbi:MAG: flagellar brake protein [Candidimonas sp.]|nr:flagellar brake protein [Candidimonas sp.]
MSTASTEVESAEQYTVSSPEEIRRLLQSVQAQNLPVRAYVVSRRAPLVTTILRIEDDTDSIVIDGTPDNGLAADLIAEENIRFETVLDHIHLRFSSAYARSCLMDKRSAFRLPIPDEIGLQRREFYRVEVPVTNAPQCNFQLRISKDEVVLNVKDISVGGICVIDDKNVLRQVPGAVYENCEIDLPEHGEIVANLRVVRSVVQELDNDRRRRLVGLAFMDLPNRMQMLVQSYIGMVERKLNAKRRGFE